MVRRHISIKRHELFVTPADTRAIGEELRRAYPGMEFFGYRYAEFTDTDASIAARQGGRRPDAPFVPLPRHLWRHRRSTRLDDPILRYSIRAFVLPPRWRPRWALDGGIPYVANWPPLRFEFHPCLFKPLSIGFGFHREPRDLPPDEEVHLMSGSFHGDAYSSIPEKLPFLRHVRRIVDSFTTREFVAVEPRTLKPYPFRLYWADFRVGFNALNWSRRRLRNLIGGSFKPIDWTQPTPDDMRDTPAAGYKFEWYRSGRPLVVVAPDVNRKIEEKPRRRRRLTASR